MMNKPDSQGTIRTESARHILPQSGSISPAFAAGTDDILFNLSGPGFSGYLLLFRARDGDDKQDGESHYFVSTGYFWARLEPAVVWKISLGWKRLARLKRGLTRLAPFSLSRVVIFIAQQG
jgi:hypothetical protein